MINIVIIPVLIVHNNQYELYVYDDKIGLKSFEII